MLVRHTPIAGPPGLCIGRTDAPLAADADAAIAAVCAHIGPAPHTGRQVVSSPAVRCRRLAEALTRPASATLDVDPRLAEFDFGQWEGRRFADIPVAEVDAWNADLENHRPPGGESLGELQARAVECLESRLGDGAGELVLITHGGVIRALVAWLLDMPLAAAPRLAVANGSLSRVRIEGDLRLLVSLNVTATP